MGFGNGISLNELMSTGEETLASLRARFGDACLVVDTSELAQAEDWTATDASVRVHTPLGVEMLPRGSSIFPILKKSPAPGNLVSVGRGEDSDIWLPHASVSRVHAYLRVGPEGIVVSDMHSENGTFVSEKRVAPRGPSTTLTATRGQTVQFGDVVALVLGPEDLEGLLAAR